MSFRPTISVYYNGEIADIGYYRNWREEALLAEAMGIALAFRDCGTLREFREKAFGGQTVYYSIDPELWENTPENLHELENCSELPMVVDMTAGCIYVSYGALCAAELNEMPEAEDLEDFFGCAYEWQLSKRRKITLTDESLKRGEELLRDFPELLGLMSWKTRGALEGSAVSTTNGGLS